MDIGEKIPSSVIVCVNAESNQTGHVGSLIIQKHHETSFSVLFYALGEMEMTDMDCVSVDVKEKRVSFFDPSTQSLHRKLPATSSSSIVHSSSYCITDRAHLHLFVEAQAECRRVCNLYLELKSRFTDMYHIAVNDKLGMLYQSGSQFHNDGFSNELARLQVQSVQKLDSDIQNIKKHPSHQATTNTTVDCPRQSYSLPARCFYCSGSHTDTELFNHPYVPLTFDRQGIFMCSTCLSNWKGYRDAAQQENQLLLQGEINEEICALCSDTPETLVLCQRCPRSYCAACLTHVLGDKATTCIFQSDNDALWRCMSCANRVSTQPLLSRDAWVSWRRLQAQISTQPPVCVEVIADTASSMSAFNRNRHPNKTISSGSSVLLSKGNTNNDFGNSALCTSTTTASVATQLKRQRDTKSSPGTSECNHASAETYKRNFNGHKRPGRSSSSRSSSSSSTDGPAHSSAKKAKPSHPTVVTATDGSKRAKVTTNAVELFYFAQYLDFLERDCAAVVARVQQKQKQQPLVDKLQHIKNNARSYQISSSQKNRLQEDSEMEETDDSCFLCKDGGEVIECDFRMKNSFIRLNAKEAACRCRKVYHSYCLNYIVPASVKTWLCPRHYCAVCGCSNALQIFCCFCPLSLCRGCAPRYPTACHKSGGYYSLPQLVPSKISETSLEVTQAVRKRFVPYSSASVELVACDSCAEFCLQLQQSTELTNMDDKTVNIDPNCEKKTYFFTKLGARCSFLEFQVELVRKDKGDCVATSADVE